MRVFPKTSDSLDAAKVAATRVGEAAQMNTLALMAVCLVATAALFIATTALVRTR